MANSIQPFILDPQQQNNIYLRFSSNSKAKASVLLEITEEMLLLYFMHNYICSRFSLFDVLPS